MDMQKDHDEVNHPKHYTQGGIECIDAIKAALGPEGFIAFLRGQVMKYNWRAGLKGPALIDARKSQWYNDYLCIALKEVQEDADAEAERAYAKFSDTKAFLNPQFACPKRDANQRT
jgi:hypothetical protein